jgi:hypothetical protein
MGTGLYDRAFLTLRRLYGDDARSAITHVKIFGGFASTVCWPLSAFLVDQWGWRGTCLMYAASGGGFRASGGEDGCGLRVLTASCRAAAARRPGGRSRRHRCGSAESSVRRNER